VLVSQTTDPGRLLFAPNLKADLNRLLQAVSYMRSRQAPALPLTGVLQGSEGQGFHDLLFALHGRQGPLACGSLKSSTW